MPAWLIDMDLGPILEALSGTLEGAKRRGPTDSPWVEGLLHGREVTVRLWHVRTGSGRSEWRASANGDGDVALYLRANPRHAGDQALVDRGAVRPMKTGDDGFDARWLIEAAPMAIARRVVDESVRGALDRLASTRPNAPPLLIERSTVSVTAHGRFEAPEVLAGVELVAVVAARIDAIGEERKASPPSNEATAAEDAEIADLRALQEKVWARAGWGMKLGILGVTLLIVLWLAVQVYDCLPNH